MFNPFTLSVVGAPLINLRLFLSVLTCFTLLLCLTKQCAFVISDLHKEAGLFQRLTKLEEEFKGANILLFKHQKIPKVSETEIK